MAGSSGPKRRRVLVIGSQGVLGSLLGRAFARAGWAVVRGGRRPDEQAGFRHVDLDEPETVAAAIGNVDLVVNPVPDRGLRAERIVLDRGGLLINVSAMPAEAGRGLTDQTTTPRGTVVMNAGIAPGLTNLIAADLLAAHPEADEVELAFTVSTKGTSGPAGGDFAHRNLTALGATGQLSFPCPSRSANAAAWGSPRGMPAGSAPSPRIGRSTLTSASPRAAPTARCCSSTRWG